MRKRFSTFVLGLAMSATAAATDGKVELLRTPNGGLQPYARVDGEGAIHLIYARGDREAGDLYYVRKRPADHEWTAPLRINSDPGTVKLYGAITRAQMALAEDGRVHVVWTRLRPAAYYYTRLNREGTGFDAQRNLLTRPAAGIGAGPSIAVYENDVIVVWHDGDLQREEERLVFVTRSTDEGRSFVPEQAIESDTEGVCACCALQARFDGEGELFVSYRSAGAGVHRDMTLLRSKDRGQSFEATRLHEWELPACPVSTTSLGGTSNGLFIAAWETKGQVYFADVDLDGVSPNAAPGDAETRRKNPTVAVNADGEVLLAWADGAGLRSGGTLFWRRFDAKGTPRSSARSAEEPIPDGSLPTAVATVDGAFVIIY